MDILKAIETRRSIAKVTDEPLARADIEKIISAGCWAPNHKRTEPWRFVVFEGEGRHKLGAAMADGVRHVYPDLSDEDYAHKIQSLRTKPFRAPLIIAVWCAAGRGKKNPPVWEDHAAVAACVQNMCLAAHGLGFGAIWRSGKVVDMPSVQKLMETETDSFDAEKGDMILGMLYVGVRDENYPEPARDEPEFASKVKWVDKA